MLLALFVSEEKQGLRRLSSLIASITLKLSTVTIYELPGKELLPC